MQKIVILIVVSLIFTFSLYSEEGSSPDINKVNLQTPYGTVHTHIRFLQEDRFKPEKAGAAFRYGGISIEESQVYAKRLLKIMDGKQLYVIMKNVPHDPNDVDSVSGDHKYILFPEEPWLYVEKSNGKWYYSKTTIEAIPDKFAETYPFELNKVTEYIPAFMHEMFLGLEIWQWLGLLVYIIFSFVLFYIFYWLLGYFLIKLFQRFAKKDVFSKYISMVAKPASILFVLMLIIAFLGVLQLPIQIGHYIKTGLKVIYPLLLTVIAYRLSDFVSDIIEKLASKTKTTVDDHFVPLVRKTLKLVAIVIGLIYTINSLGVDITPLIAGASIGGLAIALAAKETLSNFFGSVTIFTDQPFEIGDWIVFNGNEGVVEEVGVRSTRIRTFYNSQISVPNGKLADSVIDNMGRREYRRYFTKIGLTYDTPPDAFDAFVEGLRDIVDNHPDTRKDYYQIHLNEFAAYSINVMFYIFFKVPDWTAELAARHEVNSEIIKLADNLGIRFAFPTQTLHMEEMPGQESLTPIYTQSRDDFMKLKNNYSDSIKQRWKDKKSRNNNIQ
jgi:MscS family membrane protein